MHQQTRLTPVWMGICIAFASGCTATPKHRENHAKLVAVPQELIDETSGKVSSRSLAPNRSVTAKVRSDVSGGLTFCKDAIAASLKMAGTIIVGSIILIVDGMLGSEDDDDVVTPSGQAVGDFDLRMGDP